MGTRKTATLCVTAAATGIFGIAFTGENDSILLGISLFLVGLGSGGQICLQPVAGLFDDKYQGTVLASLTGAFQISGLVFLILMEISSDRKKSLGPFALSILGLVAIAVKILPTQNFSQKQKEVSRDVEVMDPVERRGEKSALEKETPQPLFQSNGNNAKDDDHPRSCQADAESKAGVGADAEADAEAGIEAELGAQSNLEDTLHSSPDADDQNLISKMSTENEHKTLSDLIWTREYMLLVLWFSVQLTPLQYYVGAIGFQLERTGDISGHYTSMFSVIYASSAAVAPILGKIADTAGLGCAQGIATLLTSASFFVLSFEDAIPLDGHVIGMLCYGVGRMIVFGMFFTNVGKRFGFHHYGTLAGLGLIISAIFSLLQYPLITMAAAGHARLVNILCGSLLLIEGLPYCFWLLRRERDESQRPPSGM